VDRFKYLGMLIDNGNNITNTIRDRILAGYKAYYANIQLLKNKNISRQTKLKIYKTTIRPVVTYSRRYRHSRMQKSYEYLSAK